MSYDGTIGCPVCGSMDQCIHAERAASSSPGPSGSVPPRRNPVRVLNDALHEYRTQHTDMSKDEFYERGCYHAFMWAWQRAAQNATDHAQGKAVHDA